MSGVAIIPNPAKPYRCGDAQLRGAIVEAFAVPDLQAKERLNE